MIQSLVIIYIYVMISITYKKDWNIVGTTEEKNISDYSNAIANTLYEYSETSGIAFSPDGSRMYFSSRFAGIIIELTGKFPANNILVPLLYHIFINLN